MHITLCIRFLFIVYQVFDYVNYYLQAEVALADVLIFEEVLAGST
jgi:hypothetical protein